MIQAVQSRLLIELKGAYDNLSTTEERFGTSKIRGYVRSIASDIEADCKKLSIKEGTMVYFGKFEDSSKFEKDGQEYALIKLEEIGGVENA